MTDFPRGWTLTNNVFSAGTAAVTFPGTSGVAHVLTDIQAQLVNLTAASAASPQVQVSLDGGATFSTLGWCVVPATTEVKDQMSYSGSLATQAGQTLIVRFSGAVVAGQGQNLVIQGYDI